MRPIPPSLMVAMLAGATAIADEERDATAAARRAMDGLPMTGPMIDTDKHNRIMREKLRSLAPASPELAEALTRRYVLRQKFEQAKAQRED